MRDGDFEGIIMTMCGFALIVGIVVLAIFGKYETDPCVKDGGRWEKQNCETHRHFVCKPSIKNAELACHFEKRMTCDDVCVVPTEAP